MNRDNIFRGMDSNILGNPYEEDKHIDNVLKPYFDEFLKKEYKQTPKAEPNLCKDCKFDKDKCRTCSERKNRRKYK